MKIKLDAREGLRILKVSETVTVEHAKVLQAGVMKLFKTDAANAIVLDLTAVPEDSAEALKELKKLHPVAKEAGARYVIVSPIVGVGDHPSLDEALKQLTSPLAKLLAREGYLKAEIRNLKGEAAALEKKVAEVAKAGGDVVALKRQNTELKRMITMYCDHIQAALKERKTEPGNFPDAEKKFDEIAKLLQPILKAQGLVK